MLLVLHMLQIVDTFGVVVWLLFVVTRIAIVETIFRRGGLKSEAQSWGSGVADLCRLGLLSHSNRPLQLSSHRKGFQEHRHCYESFCQVSLAPKQAESESLDTAIARLK